MGLSKLFFWEAISRKKNLLKLSEIAKSDEMFSDVARFVIGKGRVNDAAIQRNFKTGFQHTMDLIDALAKFGVTTNEERFLSRKSAMTLEEFDNIMSDISKLKKK